ncbi:hypothetical protein QR680_003095 [Steinernema hermaphroditum]|uniref:Uncharacterized protein n=1 Tax=Steinernema hermaphroditum TaxID=289476 RepID=A0AA39LJF8_9BILA|nr:hypothetical protein QR680_003095 [Steinernema hermaphroditum]
MDFLNPYFYEHLLLLLSLDDAKKLAELHENTGIAASAAYFASNYRRTHLVVTSSGVNEGLQHGVICCFLFEERNSWAELVSKEELKNLETFRIDRISAAEISRWDYYLPPIRAQPIPFGSIGIGSCYSSPVPRNLKPTFCSEDKNCPEITRFLQRCVSSQCDVESEWIFEALGPHSSIFRAMLERFRWNQVTTYSRRMFDTDILETYCRNTVNLHLSLCPNLEFTSQYVSPCVLVSLHIVRRTLISLLKLAEELPEKKWNVRVTADDGDRHLFVDAIKPLLSTRGFGRTAKGHFIKKMGSIEIEFATSPLGRGTVHFLWITMKNIRSGGEYTGTLAYNYWSHKR